MVRRLRNGKTLPQGGRGDDDDDGVNHSASTTHRSIAMASGSPTANSTGGGGANKSKLSSSNCFSLPKTESQYDLWHLEREKEKEERQKLVLWRRPLLTLYYCFLELFHLCMEYTARLLRRRRLIVLILLAAALIALLYATDGPHRAFLASWRKTVVLCLYWMGLGILSSVGLGTGLHTFLIYLGPFIAQVTLAAYECNSLDFPEPPYPDQIVCPTQSSPDPGAAENSAISIWSIMSKVRLEAFMWGAGTAIGELPPYFMARAARLSGLDPDDEEFDEFAQLIHEEQQLKKSGKTGKAAKLPFFQRLKLTVHHVVQKVGFLGILICASVPNPLFDLAGITCGHFLIPFWTFFGATLIGKAIIKMHVQKLFVIIGFSKHHMETILRWVGTLPAVGRSLRDLLENELTSQTEKFRAVPGSDSSKLKGDDKNIIGKIFEKVVLIMILYFVVSIINSLGQNYHKRLYKSKQRNMDQNSLVKTH